MMMLADNDAAAIKLSSQAAAGLRIPIGGASGRGCGVKLFTYNNV